jgi:hypothetical protein
LTGLGGLPMGKATSSSYSITFHLITETYQKHSLDKRFEIARQIYNACLAEGLKRIKKLKQDQLYQVTVQQSKSAERNQQLRELRLQYGCSEYSMHTFVQPMQHHFKVNIDSHTAQKIATRAWKAIEKMEYGQANKVYFKKKGSWNSLEGKTNQAGIRYKEGRLQWNGLSIPVHIRKNDEYAHVALQDRVKFCRIRRSVIRGKMKYVLQLILEGTPPQKRNKENGEARHPIGTGIVGLDIGTQTIAICSQSEVKLLELAPNINRIDHEKRNIQRRLDRQRRANNPHKYHENGTINGGNRERWVYSKRAVKTRQQLMEMERKLRVKRKQAHEQLANQILALGDEIKVEQMSFQGLAKRTKETKVDERTGKFKRKKRFGKSIGHKAPALLLGIIERKLSYQGKQLHRVDTAKLKASQYNHVEDHYLKKELHERWTDIGESRIQRDLYSAFIIMNAKDNNREVDRDACERGFSRFKKLHNNEIERLSKTTTVASMGI